MSGVAKFRLDINDQPAATWLAGATLPSRRPNGGNSTRHTIPADDLKPDDTIRIEGTPDSTDPAAFDSVEFLPSPSIPRIWVLTA